LLWLMQSGRGMDRLRLQEGEVSGELPPKPAAIEDE
jgi:hypothetical protein